jgi:hypothetical protein
MSSAAVSRPSSYGGGQEHSPFMASYDVGIYILSQNVTYYGLDFFCGAARIFFASFFLSAFHGRIRPKNLNRNVKQE